MKKKAIKLLTKFGAYTAPLPIYNKLTTALESKTYDTPSTPSFYVAPIAVLTEPIRDTVKATRTTILVITPVLKTIRRSPIGLFTTTVFIVAVTVPISPSNTTTAAIVGHRSESPILNSSFIVTRTTKIF